MKNKIDTFYKYRGFSSTTLDLLCQDNVYFANPGSFNDPLDCNPTLKCDSSNDELRKLLAFLLQRRINKEMLSNLKQASLKGERAEKHALDRSRDFATDRLNDISYHATNPDFEVETEEAESWLLVQEIERELIRYYERGVCCFSSSYSNPLLWSHYGDQHKGLCVGYGTDRNPAPELKEVIYGGNRSINTSILIKAFLFNDTEAQSDLDRDVLLRKAKGWKYEGEWRLIGKQGLQDSPLLLKEVTFGLRCSSSIIHSVVKALEGRRNEVKFYEMYIVRGSYEIRRRDLDIYELNAFLPKTAQSGVEMFGEFKEDLGDS